MKIFFILSLTLLILGSSFKIKKYSHSKFLGKEQLGAIEDRYSKLSAVSIEAYLENKKVFVVDTRNNTISSLGYLPNSLLLPLNMGYSTWFKALIKEGSNVILICDKTNYKDSLKQTEELGYNIFGYAIYDELIKTDIYDLFEIRVAEYNENTKKDVQKLVDKEKYLLDIREVSEYKETGVIKQAHLLPLSEFRDKYEKIPDNTDIYIFCKSGGRALLAMSFLQRAGYDYKLVVMRGGMTKTISEEYPLVEYSE